MFKKNKTYGDNNPSLPSAALPATAEGGMEMAPLAGGSFPEEKSGNTVIASGVRFDGNINASGQIYVYGTIIGNIDSQEGLVKIMRNGLVEGNILCRELIVDGSIKGHCQAESIDICENGRIDGTMTYASLAIKKGGLFTGQAEQLRPVEPAINVVDLRQENAADQAALVSS